MKTAARRMAQETIDKGISKHAGDFEIINRMQRAKDFIFSRKKGIGDVEGRWFRQGMDPESDNVIYWIESSELYYESEFDEKETHDAPPFYRVVLGDGDIDHDCNCADMQIARKPGHWKKDNSPAGAPTIKGKHYCKHVMASLALEHVRNNQPEDINSVAA